MKTSKIVLLIAGGLAAFFGGQIALDEYRIYRATQAVDQAFAVDGYTLSEQQEIAKKAGNDRYYSMDEINAHLEAQRRR